jgi:hypothetical protein
MLAVERRILQSEAQRLPVNSHDDTGCQERLTHQRGACARACQRLKAAAQRCADQQTVGVMVIDRYGRSAQAFPDAERIAAFHAAKRRYMQHFPTHELCVGGDRHVAWRAEQIAVALAEGVAHFGEQRAQLAVAVVTEPEADRVERVAEHARKSR